MAKDLKSGDKVEWNTPQGKTRGRVVKKVTRETRVKGHKVAASAENPEFLVQSDKSDKSGKQAAHKPESLGKVK
jgi:hypothetical protein